VAEKIQITKSRLRSSSDAAQPLITHISLWPVVECGHTEQPVLQSIFKGMLASDRFATTKK